MSASRRSLFSVLFQADAPPTGGAGASTPPGAQPGAEPGPALRGAAKRRPWWVRLLLAQEVGLVLVIAVMMTGLTLATPSIAKPEGELVKRATQPVVTQDTITYEAADGRTVTRARADGWVVSPRGANFRVERKEFTAPLNPAPQLQGAGEDARFVVGATSYSARDGWGLATTPEGQTRLERDPRVNKFFNRDNLVIVATSASFYAIMAVGLTMIIILGGIDLSVGAIYALAAVVGAYVLNQMASGAASAGDSVPTWMALSVGVGLCCLVGMACGLVNGAASVGLGVHPFIITLGGMGVYRGLAFVTTEGLSIGDLPAGYGDTMRTRVAGVEVVPTMVMLGVGLLFALVFSRTVFGRRMFAIGGNETAAKYAGVPVGRVKVIIFMLSGLLAGLSASVALGKYGSASSADGTGYELDVIAAAVVGGASLSGGRGSALGAILGAIIIQLINNGFESLGINPNYKQIVIGLAIVLAVLIDQAKHRFGGVRK
jgi:ribose/xylose/arabinose/galactoside ABC-type transport system permease subunit